MKIYHHPVLTLRQSLILLCEAVPLSIVSFCVAVWVADETNGFVPQQFALLCLGLAGALLSLTGFAVQSLVFLAYLELYLFLFMVVAFLVLPVSIVLVTIEIYTVSAPLCIGVGVMLLLALVLLWIKREVILPGDFRRSYGVFFSIWLALTPLGIRSGVPLCLAFLVSRLTGMQATDGVLYFPLSVLAIVVGSHLLVIGTRCFEGRMRADFEAKSAQALERALQARFAAELELPDPLNLRSDGGIFTATPAVRAPGRLPVMEMAALASGFVLLYAGLLGIAYYLWLTCLGGQPVASSAAMDLLGSLGNGGEIR